MGANAHASWRRSSSSVRTRTGPLVAPVVATALGLACLVASVSSDRVTVGATASAQTAAHVMSDLDRFRSALGRTLYANATHSEIGSIRLVIRDDSIEIITPDGRTREMRPEDDSIDVAWRLLTCALTTGPISAVTDALGPGIERQLLSFEVLPWTEPPILVQRMGTRRLSIAYEHGIARPRQLQLRTDDARFAIHMVSYEGIASGWYPDAFQVLLDDRVVATLTIDDLARDEASLAPLQSTTARAVTSVRFPRLPL